MTNLATLTVVVVATWWSGAQRPAQAPLAQVEPAAELLQPAVQPAARPAATQQADTEPAPLRVKANLPAATVAQAGLGGSALPAATVQTVGFKPAAH